MPSGVLAQRQERRLRLEGSTPKHSNPSEEGGERHWLLGAAAQGQEAREDQRQGASLIGCSLPPPPPPPPPSSPPPPPPCPPPRPPPPPPPYLQPLR